jgi:hypothetical protein
MGIIIRRTETLSDRIADLTVLNKNLADRTIDGVKLIRGAVGSPELGSAAVTHTNVHDSAILRSAMLGWAVVAHDRIVTELTDLGSTKTSLTEAYKSYAKAYSRPPILSLFSQDSGISYVYPTRVVEGSFKHIGSPGGKYFRYYAWAPGSTWRTA